MTVLQSGSEFQRFFPALRSFTQRRSPQSLTSTISTKTEQARIPLDWFSRFVRHRLGSALSASKSGSRNVKRSCRAHLTAERGRECLFTLRIDSVRRKIVAKISFCRGSRGSRVFSVATSACGDNSWIVRVRGGAFWWKADRESAVPRCKRDGHSTFSDVRAAITC